MKKLLVVLTFVALMLISSCTSYTCPTYAKVETNTAHG